MSVTFTADMPADTVRVFRLICDGEQGVLGEWVGHENAYSEADVHGLVCDACHGYGADVREVTPGRPEPVNMSQNNAALILRALGYLPDADPLAELALVAGAPVEGIDMCGQDTPENLLERIALATSYADYDQGQPRTSTGNVHNFGRRPGYLQDALHGLELLAEACQAIGVTVSWA